MADYPMNDEKAIKESTVSDLVAEAHKIVTEIEDRLNILVPRNGQTTEPLGKIALLTEALKTLNIRLLELDRYLVRL